MHRKPYDDEETTDEQAARRPTGGRETNQRGNDPKDQADRSAHWGLGVIEGIIAPGQLIAPHVHVDEVTYVLAGEITAEIGGEVVVAVAGSYVLKPYGVMHALWNATNQPARVMELHLPGGFEQFYVDMTAVASDDSLDQHARTEQMKAARGPSVHTHRLQQHPVDLHPDCSGRWWPWGSWQR